MIGSVERPGTLTLEARLVPLLDPGRMPWLTPLAWERLEALEGMLLEWSAAVGLVGFKSEKERDRRYFGEALVAAGDVPEDGSALDVGTGGGAPALPLAIARPGVRWTLVESNERKATFLREAVERLGLGARVECVRYESWETPRAFDLITVRGVHVTLKLRARMRRDLTAHGRLLWFSSRGRLDDARLELGLAAGSVVELLPGAGFLLRVERSAL